MASFAVCFNKKGHAISEELFLPMHAALQQYAIDGSHYLIDKHVAFSCQAFWTTPEEWEEVQPIKFADRYYLVWDGRIDNRQELYDSLVKPTLQISDFSDAELFLAFYLEHGLPSLQQIIGSFAWLVFDRAENQIIATRDSMGGRYLVYAETDEWICFASTVQSITAHPAFPFKLNPRLAAQHFSFAYANEDSTFCQNVKIVLPGHYVSVTGAQPSQQHEFYLPAPTARIRYQDAREYSQHFKEIFTEAVASRLRSVTPIASMLSGGLDSSPITVSAASLLGEAKQLFGVTWSFDALTECDERDYLKEIYQRYPIAPVWVNCDDAYPLNAADDWPVNPDQPFDFPYRGKHLRAYQAIQDNGCRVTLSGMSGDDLYSGTELIAYEYLWQLRLNDAIKELTHRFRYASSLNIFLRTHLFWYTQLWFKLKGRSIFQAPHITRRAFIEMQTDNSFLGDRAKSALRPKQYDQLIGTYYSNPLSTEKYFSTPYQTQVRYPLRDRRLVEFMLQIPSEYLYSNGVTRPIVRQAFQADLPTSIINRRGKTNFYPLLSNLKKAAVIKSGRANPRDWSYYVKSDWIAALDIHNMNHLMILWQTNYWDYWMQRRNL